MTDEKWQRVREVFAAAWRRRPEERRKFVNEVCGDDKTLLAEVESLLLAHAGAESFMETPAVAEAHMIESETKKLETANVLGHYEIIKQIGVGGMGEVYIAKVACTSVLGGTENETSFGCRDESVFRRGCFRASIWRGKTGAPGGAIIL